MIRPWKCLCGGQELLDSVISVRPTLEGASWYTGQILLCIVVSVFIFVLYTYINSACFFLFFIFFYTRIE